jgi:hypothetical protein
VLNAPQRVNALNVQMVISQTLWIRTSAKSALKIARNARQMVLNASSVPQDFS